MGSTGGRYRSIAAAAIIGLTHSIRVCVQRSLVLVFFYLVKSVKCVSYLYLSLIYSGTCKKVIIKVNTVLFL